MHSSPSCNLFLSSTLAKRRVSFPQEITVGDIMLPDKAYRKALAKLVEKVKEEWPSYKQRPLSEVQVDVMVDFVHWFLTDEDAFGQMTIPEEDLRHFTERLAEKLEVDSPYLKTPIKTSSMYVVLIGDKYLELDGDNDLNNNFPNLCTYKEDASTFPTEAIAFLHASLWFLEHPEAAEKLYNKTVLVIQS